MNLSFLSYIGIDFVALIFLLITSVDYFKKRKIWTIENYVYTLINLISFLVIISGSSILLCANIYPNEQIIVILNKILLASLVMIITVFNFYIFLLASKKNQGYISLAENKEAKYWFICTIIFILIAFVVYLGVAFTKGYFMEPEVNGFLYYTGMPTTITYIYLGASLIFIVIWLILGGKRINSKAKLPFYLFITIGPVAGVLQMLFPDVVIIYAVIAFIVVLFNFTIENPDLYLIENLNIAKRSADKANRAKSDFLSNMSHEIRTPLNAIVGFSHALAEENLPEDVRGEVNDIIESSNSLLNVINNILDISKMDAGGVVITDVHYNTNNLVRGLVTYAKEACEKKGLTFVSEIDKDLPSALYGDNVRIKQIATNLLSNAIKYTKSGTVTLTIKAVPLKKNCKLYIYVKDTGIGIEESDISKIYDQFNKLDNDLATNYAVGTGLGLTISKRLLEMMDGYIDFESTAGKGSNFLVAIDQEISDKHIEDIQTYVEDELKFFDASKNKIVIIDDNTVNLKVAKKLFKDYNSEPDLAKGANEIIEKVKSGVKYDLILIDDMMPGLTGTEALAIFKEIPGFNIPIVITTANQQPGVREKYAEAGFAITF